MTGFTPELVERVISALAIDVSPSNQRILAERALEASGIADLTEALTTIRNRIPANCAAWSDEMDIRTIAETALAKIGNPDRITPDWCANMAEHEIGHEVGAGKLAIDAMAGICSFCSEDSTTSVGGGDHDTFESCAECAEAWEKNPGFWTREEKLIADLTKALQEAEIAFRQHFMRSGRPNEMLLRWQALIDRAKGEA